MSKPQTVQRPVQGTKEWSDLIRDCFILSCHNFRRLDHDFLLGMQFWRGEPTREQKKKLVRIARRLAADTIGLR